MSDFEKVKEYFEKLLNISKDDVATEFKIKQDKHEIREEYALAHGYRTKKGDLDIKKVNITLIMLAIALEYNITDKDTFSEKVELFDEYQTALKNKDDAFNYDKIDNLIEHLNEKTGLKADKNEILGDMRDDIEEDDCYALQELVSMVIKNEKIEMTEEFNKENGIESKAQQSERIVPFDKVKELADKLGINLKKGDD